MDSKLGGSQENDLSIHEIEAKIGCIAKRVETCSTHGKYIAVTFEHKKTGLRTSGCNQCADDAKRAQDAAELVRHKSEQARKALESRLQCALIPPRYEHRNFADFHATTPAQAKVLRVCTEYAENFPAHMRSGRSLLLLGDVGTGKTHLATAIAQYVIRFHGLMALYTTVSRISRMLKGSFVKGASYTEGSVYSDMVRPHLLIVDEVGASNVSDFERAALFEVVNYRYEDQMPTVLISNLGPKELPACLGERTVDRLREEGGIALTFDWPSSRAKRVSGGA